MNVKIKDDATSYDSEFHMAFGWLAAAAASIACWAGLS